MEIATTSTAPRSIVRIQCRRNPGENDLDASIQSTPEVIGTGVLVAPDRVLTAWHVVEKFTRTDGVIWSVFHQASGEKDGERFIRDCESHMLGPMDLALVRITGTLPHDPIQWLSGSPPRDRFPDESDLPVYGYPKEKGGSKCCEIVFRPEAIGIRREDRTKRVYALEFKENATPGFSGGPCMLRLSGQEGCVGLLIHAMLGNRPTTVGRHADEVVDFLAARGITVPVLPVGAFIARHLPIFAEWKSRVAAAAVVLFFAGLLITIAWNTDPDNPRKPQPQGQDQPVKSYEEHWAEFQEKCKELMQKPGANAALVAYQVTQQQARIYKMALDDYKNTLMEGVPGAEEKIKLIDQLRLGNQASAAKLAAEGCAKRWEVALAAYGAGQYSKANNTCDQIAELAVDYGFPQIWYDAQSLKIDALTKLGAIQDAEEEADRTLEWLRELLREQKVGLHPVASLTVRLAKLHGERGLYEDAIGLLTDMECELWGEDHPDSCPMVPKIFLTLADLNEAFGDYDAAHIAYERAASSAAAAQADPEEAGWQSMNETVAIAFINFRLRQGDTSVFPELVSHLDRNLATAKIATPYDAAVEGRVRAFLAALKRRDFSVFASEALSFVEALPLKPKDATEISGTLESLQPFISTPEQINRVEVQVTRATKVLEEAGSDGDAGRIKAGNVHGQLLSKSGKAKEAVDHWRKTYDEHESLYGNEHPETLAVAHDLGVALADNGEFDEAIEVLSNVLTARRAMFLPGQKDRWTSARDLSEAILIAGRKDAVVEPLEQEWKDCVLRWGANHRQTLLVESVLGKILNRVGNAGEAEAHLRNAFTKLEQLPGVGFSNQMTLEAGILLAKVLAKKPGDEEALPLLRRIVKAEDEIGADWPIAIETSVQLFNALNDRELYSEALPVIERIVKSRRKLAGNDDEQVLHDVSAWCMILHRLDRNEEAERMARSAYQRWKEIRPRDLMQSPEALVTLGWLANALYGQKKYSEAEPIYRDVLAAREKLAPGRETEQVLIDCQNLGNLLYDTAGYPEAEAQYRRVLEGRRKLFPEGHEDILDVLNRLGNALYNQEKYGEAEPLYREALTGRESQTQGKETEIVLTVVQNLGGLLFDTGRYPEAEVEFRRVLEGRRKLFPEGHEEILEVLNRLGNTLLSEGKYKESETFFLEAIAGWKARGDKTEELFTVLVNFGNLLDRNGRFPESETAYREALDGRKTLYPPDHEMILDMQNSVARALHKQKNYGNAEPLYREALARRERQAQGRETEDVLAVAENLAHLLHDTDANEEAAALFDRVLQGRRKLHEPGHDQILYSLWWAAHTLEQLGRYSEAEGLFAERLAAIEKKENGKETEATLAAASSLGWCLVKADKFLEAKKIGKRLLDGRRKPGQEPDEDTIDALHLYAVAIEEVDGAAFAEPLFAEALAGRRRLNGDKDSKSAHMELHMAEMMHKRGADDEAKPLAWRAYRSHLAEDGPEYRHTKRARRLLTDLGENPDAK